MIPNIELLNEEIIEITYPDRTYKIVHGDEEDRISGYAEEIKALEQTIYLILNTERYDHNIYSFDYGVELVDLFGQPMSYVIAELPRRITDALTQDDRIEDVTDFEFEKKKDKLYVTFTVISIYGDIKKDLEVRV